MQQLTGKGPGGGRGGDQKAACSRGSQPRRDPNGMIARSGSDFRNVRASRSDFRIVFGHECGWQYARRPRASMGTDAGELRRGKETPSAPSRSRRRHLDLDDLVVDRHPPAAPHDHVDLFRRLVRVAVRDAIARRDALVAQAGVPPRSPTELESGAPSNPARRDD